MALLATLEGLGVPARKGGGIFGACLGAFEQENDTIREEQEIAVRGVNNKPSEPNFELGPWDYPISEFLSRFQQLKRNSPQYNDEEAAAITYFGMIAQQPKPTADYTDIAIDWATVDSIAYNKDLVKEKASEEWATLGPNYTLSKFEQALLFGHNYQNKYYQTLLGMSKARGKWVIYFLYEPVRVTRSIRESYEESVRHLNRWLKYNGLYSGVQKTLSEESRRLQGLRAQALASQQAAARALALSKASENVSQDTIEKYERQLKEAQVKENEITDYLNKINNTPKDTGNLKSFGGSSLLPLLGLAAAAAFAFMG